MPSCTKLRRAARIVNALHRVVIFFALLLTAVPGMTYAENSVEIESKWVDAGAVGVNLGVYFKNEVPLMAVLIPLEIRSVHVGAFIRRSLDVTLGARFIDWAGEDPPISTELYFPYRSLPNDPSSCPTDSAGRIWRWLAHDSLPDFLGEEALMYFFTPGSDEPRNLTPGNDGESGSGVPSLSLVFDVTDVGGAFIIDTTCTSPHNHLVFVDMDWNPVLPEFRPAIVLIGCNAECHGDPVCDGRCDLVDIVKSIDVAFNGAPSVIDPDPRCPVENTDVNCDMVTDVLDIVKMISVQYRMSQLEDEFCAPCEYIPRTSKPKDDVRTPYFRNSDM